METPLQRESLFSSFRSFFYVEPHRRTKVIYFCLLKILLSVGFVMLKVQKDSNFTCDTGVTKISNMKVVVVFASFLMVVLYSFLAHCLTRRRLYYTIIGFFIVSLLLSTFVLLPNEKYFTPQVNLDDYAPVWRDWMALYKSWIWGYYYCIAEFWGQFCIVLLFWTLANDVFTKEEAKRFYPFFIVAGCFGSIMGGYFLQALAYSATYNIVGVVREGALDQKVAQRILGQLSKWVGVICVILLLKVALIYNWIQDHHFNDRFVAAHRVTTPKVRFSFKQGWNYLRKNAELQVIALLVMSCSVATGLTDITYKSYASESTQKAPYYFIGFIQGKTLLPLNLLSIVGSLIITPWFLRHFGWKVAAYLAPVSVLITGCSFFIASSLNGYGKLGGLASLVGWSTAKLMANLGAFATVLDTFVRYSFFDVTKEMAYFTLDKKTRKQGKAAVDVVGSRIGKGFSSVIHVFLLSCVSYRVGDIGSSAKVSAISPFLLMFFTMFSLAWLTSVHRLAAKLEGPDQSLENH